MTVRMAREPVLCDSVRGGTIHLRPSTSDTSRTRLSVRFKDVSDRGPRIAHVDALL